MLKNKNNSTLLTSVKEEIKVSIKGNLECKKIKNI